MRKTAKEHLELALAVELGELEALRAQLKQRQKLTEDLLREEAERQSYIVSLQDALAKLA